MRKRKERTQGGWEGRQEEDFYPASGTGTDKRVAETQHIINTVLEHLEYGVVVKALCYKPEDRGFDTR
jgi:hypothetical protein